MDHERFRDWFSRVDELTATQRKEVAAVLSDPPEGAASLAAIELGVDDERRCPGCTTRSVGCPLVPRLPRARRSRSPPSAAGLRRARRIAGATAFLLRFARRRTGLPGSSRLTRPSFWRAARGSGSWTASRAGAAARPANAASRASRCRSWSPPTVAARPSAIPCRRSTRTA